MRYAPLSYSDLGSVNGSGTKLPNYKGGKTCKFREIIGILKEETSASGKTGTCQHSETGLPYK